MVWLAISPAALIADDAVDRRTIDDAFTGKLAKLAAKCDELKLADQAQATRAWRLPRDPRRQ